MPASEDTSVDPAGKPVNEASLLVDQALALKQTDRASEAEPLLRRALAIATSQLGPDHPQTAACQCQLGEFLGSRGSLEEALSLLHPAAASAERLYGADSVETGVALNHLALGLRRAERFAEAEPLYRRSLAILERAHGPDSVELAGVLNNYAQVLSATGRPLEAEPLMRRVIEIFEKHLGGQHPAVAIALNNLARVLAASGRTAEAEAASRRHLRILQIFEETSGSPHVHKTAALEGYAEMLRGVGLAEDAIRGRIEAVLRGDSVEDLPSGDEEASDSASESGAEADFDRLAGAASLAGASPNPGTVERDALYSAVFRLEAWHFIARGEPPDVHPYAASNPMIANGAPMLKAFTDTGRLQAFARENGLTDADGTVNLLTLPVSGVMPTLAAYAEMGVTHLHFNADRNSNGFYAPISRLPWLREHLQAQGLL